MSIPKSLEEAARKIRNVRIRLIQVGRITGRFCFQVVAGPKVYDLMRSVTEVYQDIGNTYGCFTGEATAVVRPDSRLISLIMMSR